jgi:hypothetical protein
MACSISVYKSSLIECEEYMSRIRGPYVRLCERDEAKASPYSIGL